MGYFFIFLGSISASFSSLALSKSLHHGASIRGYLSSYFLVSFLISSLLNGIFSFNISFNVPMSLLGLVVSFLIMGLMFWMGKAIQKGPSGLTFAFQNSGAILPPLLMALIFKEPFGFSLTIGNLIGIGLVTLGLFWAAIGTSKISLRKEWLWYALLIFFVQGLILTIFQYRCLLIQEGLPSHFLIPFSCSQEADLWFMPVIFFSAWVCQVFNFSFSEKRLPKMSEMIGGSLGGLANGLSTFFLLRATLVATPVEKAMLFPLFTVLVILLCNLYGKLMYKEIIPWKAHAFAMLGIFIGMSF